MWLMAQMKAFGILNKNLASDFPSILFRSSVTFFADVINCKHPKWINSTFEKYKVFSPKHLGFPSLGLMNFPNPEISLGIIPMPRVFHFPQQVEDHKQVSLGNMILLPLGAFLVGEWFSHLWAGNIH